MRIVLLCATQRGYLFLKKLTELLPQCQLVVFSFREEPWEPAFLGDIRELTMASGGELYETTQVGSSRWSMFWDSASIDLMFVISWRYMIPAIVYRKPHLGTFVFHDSLLPEYRGFTPTVWAMINGETHTGVTLFEIADEVDSGDIIDQRAIHISTYDTIAVVMERVTHAYLDMLERNLGKLMDGSAPRHPQEHARATYTCKRTPYDNRIDWTASSRSIYNLIRAVSAPYPGAYTYLSGQKLRVWAAVELADVHRYVGRIAGRVIEHHPGEGSVVLTGDGALLLTQVQLEGGDIVCASDVLDSVSQTLGR